MAGSALGLSEEAVQSSAGGVEGSLFVFRAVVDEWAAILVDQFAEQLWHGNLFQRRVFMQIADDFSAQQPEVVVGDTYRLEEIKMHPK